MSRFIPYPLLSICLLLFWLTMTAFSPGYFVLGLALSLLAGRIMSRVHPPKPRIRRWSAIPRLLATLAVDILRSNIAVARQLLTEGRNGRKSQFVVMTLQVRDPNALAVLSIIVTATPGTAWIEYSSVTDQLILHIFDGTEAEHYRDVIRNTYEPMLMEIFE